QPIERPRGRCPDTPASTCAPETPASRNLSAHVLKLGPKRPQAPDNLVLFRPQRRLRGIRPQTQNPSVPAQMSHRHVQQHQPDRIRVHTLVVHQTNPPTLITNGSFVVGPNSTTAEPGTAIIP